MDDLGVPPFQETSIYIHIYMQLDADECESIYLFINEYYSSTIPILPETVITFTGIPVAPSKLRWCK